MTQPAQPREIRIAEPTDREVVVATTVAAFADDPAFRYFFADEDTFDEAASRFVGLLFDKRVDHRAVWMTDDGSALAMWSPPDGPGESDTESSPMEQALVPFAGAFDRLTAYDQKVDALVPADCWYLGILATHPSHWGKGLGRGVMRVGLDTVASASGTAFLETTNPDNVGMYQASGWTIDGETDVDTLHVWVLRHDG